jgi:hypothetical protein
MAKIEDTTGAVHDFAERLFNRIRQLTGSEPSFYSTNGWYKCTDEVIFLFARINGDPTRAKGRPPNSIELQALWDDGWERQEEVSKNPKALWGNTAGAEACFPAKPDMLEKAIKFVETAFDLHRRRRIDELWKQVWGELRGALSRQPRCPEHPQFPCISTLGQGAVNDILHVDQDAVRVRSHRTGNEDVIPASSFRAWWSHLQQHGSAALDPNDPNCPRSDRAVLVGAIFAGCLPDRVKREGGQIRLLLPPAPQAHDLNPPPGRVEATISRIVRDTKLTNRVKAMHNFECQICGHFIMLADGSRYAEAHHVKPLGEPHNGPDVMENIICLCPNHHAACDLGAIPLDSTALCPAPRHCVGEQYIEYHNQTVYGGNRPTNG